MYIECREPVPAIESCIPSSTHKHLPVKLNRQIMNINTILPNFYKSTILKQYIMKTYYQDKYMYMHIIHTYIIYIYTQNIFHQTKIIYMYILHIFIIPSNIQFRLRILYNFLWFDDFGST